MRKKGILFEISPFGTGFIDDSETHRALGFHPSMLGDVNKREGCDWPHLLEGTPVYFVEEAGKVLSVELAATAGER